MTLRPLSLPAAPDGAECEVCPQESAMVQIVVYLRPGPCPTLPVSGLRPRKSGPNSRVVPREARLLQAREARLKRAPQRVPGIPDRWRMRGARALFARLARRRL